MANKKRAAGPARKKKAERDITPEILPFPQNELEIHQWKWSEKQKAVIDCILNPKSNIIFLESPAGCGKSLLSLFCGLSSLKEKFVNKILYVRSPVESCDAKIGFLPSTMEDKMQPYTQVADDCLLTMISKSDLERLRADGTLATLPVGFAKGLSFHNTFVILDEAQDLTSRDLELICGRFGKRCKMMVIGSVRQTNIKNEGLSKTMDFFDNDTAKEKGIYCFRFDKSDSQRSPIAEFIADTFDKINFPQKKYD